MAVTVAIALVQMAIFMGLGAAAFGLQPHRRVAGGRPAPGRRDAVLHGDRLLAGAVAKTTEGAVNMANFLVLPMAFLSGSFFPLDAAPEWLQTVSRLLPLWLNEGMLDVMVRGEPWSTALLPMAILAVFADRRDRAGGQAVPLGDGLVWIHPAASQDAGRDQLRRVRRVRPAWDAGSLRPVDLQR